MYELKEKLIFQKYFYLLLLLFPITTILGPTVSLSNIILINISFLILLFKINNFLFLKSYPFKLLLALYVYLIFNTFISIDQTIGLARNLGFLRFVILFVFINYFFYNYNSRKILDYWVILFSIFLSDVFIEYFFGSNIFGWGAIEINGVPQPHGPRVVSFFKDEPIAGAFLISFMFMLFGHLLSNQKLNKIFAWIFLAIALLGILLTGERSNFIKAFLGFFIFFSLVDFLRLKLKIFFGISFLALLTIILIKSPYLNNRFINQAFEQINSKEKLEIFYEENVYAKLYKSGFSVFKNYPYFGVGNKNYRVEVCDTKNHHKSNYYCLTHPHQVYIEFLSEHGLFGTIILLGIFFFMMFKILKEITRSQNYVQLGAFVFIVINFTPIIPTGSFFSDFNSTNFWLNVSIMYACNSNTNIFDKYNKT